MCGNHVCLVNADGNIRHILQCGRTCSEGSTRDQARAPVGTLRSRTLFVKDLAKAWNFAVPLIACCKLAAECRCVCWALRRKSCGRTLDFVRGAHNKNVSQSLGVLKA